MSSSRIIVGVDGAQGGTDALALARRLASPGTEIVAVSVVVTDGHPSRAVNLDYDRVMSQEAQGWLAELREQEPDLRSELLPADSVGAGLHAAVGVVDGDLIVVGSCRRGALGRIFAGDDVYATLRGAPCPVAVAPRDYAVVDAPIATIGLAWNGGGEGERALDFAEALADDLGAQVHGLTVVNVPAWPAVAGTSEAEAIAGELEVAAARLAALPHVEGTTATGVAVDELATFAAEVDVLVVGSRQVGPLGRIVLGSTSEKLTRRCVRPLVVVPRVAESVTTAA